MISTFPELAIPPDVLRKWQRIVDLLADIMHVPSAVVTLLEGPQDAYYRTIVSSDSNGNPFPADDTFAMDIGTFCETVIKSRSPLLVADALEDPAWRSAPEIGVGMVSYLGFPVSWPDGRMFGTICVLDDKANHYSDPYQELLAQCRDVLQADLQTLARLGGELEEQRTHFSELFERVPEAVVMVDSAARISRVNPAFTTILGHTPGDAIGQELIALLAPPAVRAEVDGSLRRMVQMGQADAVETVCSHSQGANVPVLATYVPISSRISGNAGYVIYRDLTEARRLEEERRRYHELELALAHANRIATAGQLSASIAHELNQPLTGIVTNSSTCLRMLTGDPLNVEGAREGLRRSLRDATRAAEIIAGLRALFARKAPASDPVDLNEATREVVALSLEELQRRRVTLSLNLAEDPQVVTGDRVQLQQVILNLLRNAMDAMHGVDDRPRAILITTQPEEGGCVRVSVQDSGVGFDPQASGALFGPFYSTKPDGMGVGLSVSRSIIESHRGRLWATLNDGPGATFAFAVPARGRSRGEPGTGPGSAGEEESDPPSGSESEAGRGSERAYSPP